MNRYYQLGLRNPCTGRDTFMYLCFLLLLLLIVTSCNGQDKTARSSEVRDSVQEKKTLTHHHPGIVKTQGTVSGTVGRGLLDKAGHLWFGTGGEGIYRYDGTSFTNFTTKDGLCDNNVSAIIEDRAGNILIGTRKGICRFDGTSFTSFTANDDASKKRITSLLEDRKGNIWFGTMNDGIYRYDGKTFTNFLTNYEHPFKPGRHNQFIIDMLQDKAGNIWFCSWNGGGVWRYDGKSFQNFLPSADYYKSNEDGRSFGSALPKTTTYQPKDDITDDMIFSVSEDRAGNLWFGTRDHGACRFDGKSFKSFWKQEGFAVSRGAYSVLEDRSGNFWFTTEKEGVWRYDGKSFQNFTTKDGLHNNSVFNVVEDKNGNLWFGSRDFGLSRYDGKTFTDFSEQDAAE